MSVTCRAKAGRRSTRKQFLLNVVALAASAPAAPLRGHNGSPKVLLVVAHPDDEYTFAATVYRITHELKGVVDQIVITNGEAGYRYSKLAEAWYGLPLTSEATGRSRLPAIRKQETICAGRILGIRHHFFLDQRDGRFTLDGAEALTGMWNADHVRSVIAQKIGEGEYDFIFVLLPTAETHGHHQAAALLTVQALRRLPVARRPVLLASEPSTETVPFFRGRPDVPSFRVYGNAGPYRVDRSAQLPEDPALSYNIVVNWVIAEHKSQGLFQTETGRHSYENFWVLDTGVPRAHTRAGALFAQLETHQLTGTLAEENRVVFQ